MLIKSIRTTTITILKIIVYRKRSFIDYNKEDIDYTDEI
jgi:hypothetical protein